MGRCRKCPSWRHPDGLPVLCCRYGFHKEAAGGSDAPGQRKARLLQLFGRWNADVVDLIKVRGSSAWR